MVTLTPEPVESHMTENQGCTRQDQSTSEVGSMFKIKSITFRGRSTSMLIENEAGECALLAICNVLLLKGQLRLEPGLKEVSEDDLVALVSDELSVPFTIFDDAKFREMIANSITSLGNFSRTIDIDVKFNGIEEFAPTSDRLVFRLLGVSIYHGFLVKDRETFEAIGSRSYNTLIKLLLKMEPSESDTMQLIKQLVLEVPPLLDEDITPRQWKLIRRFLNANPSQLTSYGFICLALDIPEGRACVFFRRRRFRMMFNFEGELYLLITNENGPVWEKLIEIGEAPSFFTSDFKEFEAEVQLADSGQEGVYFCPVMYCNVGLSFLNIEELAEHVQNTHIKHAVCRSCGEIYLKAEEHVHHH